MMVSFWRCPLCGVLQPMHAGISDRMNRPVILCRCSLRDIVFVIDVDEDAAMFTRNIPYNDELLARIGFQLLPERKVSDGVQESRAEREDATASQDWENDSGEIR